MTNSLAKKILILSANPIQTNPLRLAEEVREIKEALRRSRFRDHFLIESAEAVRYRDIQRAILDSDPKIVHFSGHGEGEDGLVFEDKSGQAKLIHAETLVELFKNFDDLVECVVLNACHSHIQAEAIARHIPYVVGMNRAIGDRAAIEFAIGFYDAVGAGKDYERAFNLGCGGIDLSGIPENQTPKLYKKETINIGALEQNRDDRYFLDNVFTDADDVRKAFDKLVFKKKIPISLLLIFGPKSVGKTTALKMCRLLCHDQGISAVLVDAENIKSVAYQTQQINILETWTKELDKEGVKLNTFKSTLKRYNEEIPSLAKKDSKIAPIYKKIIKPVKGFDSIVTPTAISDDDYEEFLSWIRNNFSPEDSELYRDLTQAITKAFLKDLNIAVASGNRIVLMIDTYEKIVMLEDVTLHDWMCNLTKQLPNNVLLVIASCKEFNWVHDWHAFSQRTVSITMEEMKPDALRELIYKSYKHNANYSYGKVDEPDPQQVEEIVKFARGIPCVACTVITLWINHNVKNWKSIKSDVVSDLVQNYLMKYLSESEKRAFKIAAILRDFDDDSLKAIIKAIIQDCDDKKANELYDELVKWPFVLKKDDAFDERKRHVILEGIRHVILEDIRNSSRDLFSQLHKAALNYYQSQLENELLDKRRRDRFNLETLYHEIGANEQEGMKLFQESAEDLATSKLREQLRGLLADANSFDLYLTSSKLWKRFYDARLKELDRDLKNAAKIYQEIAENEEAKPKLRAYALFDLGRQYSSREKIYQAEKAISLLTKSLNTLEEPDGRVIFAYRDLWLLYTWTGRPEEGIQQLNKLLSFHEKRGNTDGIVATLGLFKGAYAMKGDWTKAYSVITRGRDLLECLDKPSNMRSILSHSFEDCPWIYTWSGRYHTAESVIRKELKFFAEIKAIHENLFFLKDRGLVLGLQGQYPESLKDFTQVIEQRRQEKDRNEAEIAGSLGYWGLILTRQGKNLTEAEKHLTESLRIKEEIKDEVGIPEVRNWLGELYETKSQHLEDELQKTALECAKFHYNKSLDFHQLERYYLECGARVGLARVNYLEGNYQTTQSYLAEAESLIQQYEYNDYAAVSRLIQGHIVWLSNTTSNLLQDGIGEDQFDKALSYYKESLIYALRYNRFLLDEILSGRSPRATTLIKPIIYTCQECGKEGQRMLIALRSWWQEGTNDLSTSQSETISPIPIGIPLQEAEFMARNEERGDGSPQKTTIEQINEVLASNMKD